MNHKTIYTAILSCVLIFTSATGFAFAEGQTAENSPNIVPGQPGTVFRYVQTFGETGMAYLPNPQHQYLNTPFGIDLDDSGNLWVAEENGNSIVEYAPDGSFLQSIGTPGSQSQADVNHFAYSLEVAFDPAGDPWVVDSGSHRVVKYDQAGNYLTQLGITWGEGSDNDHFNGPAGVAFDSAGHIYVADTGNHRIQIFDSSGVYSTTLGVTSVSGLDNDHFNTPFHIFIDGNDNLFVADTSNNRVQVFDNNHNYVATLGVSGESGSDNGHMTRPEGVAADTTSIYVVDSGNHRVQIFDQATFSYQDTLGWGTGNYAFDWPSDAALDSNGNLYVADTFNHRVQKYNSSLVHSQTFGVTDVPYVSDGYHFNGPEGVAVDATGRIAIAEGWWYGHRLVVLNATGEPLFIIGEAGIPGSDNAHFNCPEGVTFDNSGNVYVVDSWNNRIQIFNSDGDYQATLGTGYGQGNNQFYGPKGVAVDSKGNIYVADSFNHRVQIFDKDLNYVATLGVTGEPGSDNDHFNWPLDVDVDASGKIYVVDTNNQRVQIFDSSYTWQKTLGVTGEEGGDFDHFNSPWGIALDLAGNIYVSEKFGPRVQVFDPSGAYLTTIAGAWGTASGRLRSPAGVAVDAEGNVYVADLDNHRVQKFALGVPDWQQVNLNGFGERHSTGITALEQFNGQLYAGTFDGEAGGRIYRSSDGTNWSAVTEPGFGAPYMKTIPAIIDLAVFDGQLYAGAGWDGVPGQVWRSPDGTTWEPVTTDGFGNGSNIAVTALAVFNNLLYAGTGNVDSGAQIWRSASGDGSDWTRVAPDEPGTSDNRQVTDLTAFKGALYAAVEADEETSASAQVWRSANGSGWDTVIADGFGDSDNVSTGGFAEFGGYLYLGVRNVVSGAQLWRSADGTTWKQVVGDGFGDTANYKVEMLTVFANQLYAEVNNDETGLQILRTSDGTNWEQVNIDGFGDSNNADILWNNSIAKYKGYLYLGTWNPANGGEVWKYDLPDNSVYMPMMRR